MQSDQPKKQESDLVKYVVLFFGGLLILAGTIYASYRYSRTFSGNIILPNGVTYTGPTPIK